MTAPMPGVYHVYVNYWGNFGPGGYHFDESTRKIGDLMLVRSVRRG